MTKKTTSRRERDAQKRIANGGKLPNARVNRETVSRAWYDLKATHARTQQYIAQLADRMYQYNNLQVLAQVAKNGEEDRFNHLINVMIPQHAETVGTDLQQLWDMHKDRKGRCITIDDVELAMSIANGYEKFDVDFFRTFQPIITELNAIFNKALKQLLDEKAELDAKMIKEVQTKAIDFNSPVPVYEQPAENTVTGTAIADLEVPAELKEKIKPRGENGVTVPIDDLAYLPDPNELGKAIASGTKVVAMAMVDEDGNPIAEAADANGTRVISDLVSVDPENLTAEQKLTLEEMKKTEIPETWPATTASELTTN